MLRKVRFLPEPIERLLAADAACPDELLRLAQAASSARPFNEGGGFAVVSSRSARKEHADRDTVALPVRCLPAEVPEVEAATVVTSGTARIVEIRLNSLALLGTANFDCIPSACQVFNLSGNGLEGLVTAVSAHPGGAVATFSARHSDPTSTETRLLQNPLSSAWSRLTELRVLQLYSNSLSGPFNLTVLPPLLEELNISRNNFSGAANLSALPKTLRLLDISRNNFCGYLNLTRLPPALMNLNASINNLSGPLDLTKLDGSLEFLILNNNHFTGCIDVSNLPPSLKHLTLFSNHLGPPGRRAEFGSGCLGIAEDILQLIAQRQVEARSKPMIGFDEVDSQGKQSLSPEVLKMERRIADIFPPSLGSVFLACNHFNWPVGLTGSSASFGATRVTF
jgi:hypothetical protein